MLDLNAADSQHLHCLLKILSLFSSVAKFKFQTKSIGSIVWKCNTIGWKMPTFVRIGHRATVSSLGEVSKCSVAETKPTIVPDIGRISCCWRFLKRRIQQKQQANKTTDVSHTLTKLWRKRPVANESWHCCYRLAPLPLPFPFPLPFRFPVPLPTGLIQLFTAGSSTSSKLSPFNNRWTRWRFRLFIQ